MERHKPSAIGWTGTEDTLTAERYGVEVMHSPDALSTLMLSVNRRSLSWVDVDTFQPRMP